MKKANIRRTKRGTRKRSFENDGAFDEFIELVRESFERGGINYVLSEKVSAIMQEVAERRMKEK